MAKSKKNLQIRPEQCSRLGQEILKHMETHEISMCEMAGRAGLTQPGLRACCWHRANPTEDTLQKLSLLMGIPYKTLQMWVFEDRIKYGYQAGPAEALLIATEHMIVVLRELTVGYPEGQRPSEYEIMHDAFNNVMDFVENKRRKDRRPNGNQSETP